LRRNQQGYVLVELSVNTEGRVTKTIILKSSGINSIDNAVLKAARQSIFVKQKENTNFTVAYELKISK
jgi:TonB family protein